MPTDLKVNSIVKEEILNIYRDAKRFKEKERWDDEKFWRLSTEWVEAVGDWINRENEVEHTIGSLAQKYGVFEGNIQKMLLKVAGLVEEMQALGTLSGSVELLRKLENCREILLRDIVIAESLYLRL